MWIKLRREGWRVNRKQIYRLYKEEGLCVGRAQLLSTKTLHALHEAPHDIFVNRMPFVLTLNILA
ncbi:transposase [Planctomycetaceae bacterium AH-315-I19]|nr:transposase [Planctomycetaceae bacterium AH-315-I19]